MDHLPYPADTTSPVIEIPYHAPESYNDTKATEHLPVLSRQN